MGTYGVFLCGYVNWTWSVVLWCYKNSGGGEDTDTFQIWLYLGILTAGGTVARMILGNRFQFGLEYCQQYARWNVENATSIVMCSFHEGLRYPHLHWRFNLAQVDFLPSGWAWFTTSIMLLTLYKPRVIGFAVTSWTVLIYVIPRLILPVEETMSLF